MLTVNEKREALLEGEEYSKDLCDHCLGRQFAQLGHGLENYERGAIVRETEDLEEEDFVRENIPEDAELGGHAYSGENMLRSNDSENRCVECEVCQGVFNQLDHYVNLVTDAFDRHDLSTFLIGIRPPEQVVAAEEKLWEEHGIEWTEPIKTELSRLIGKKIEEELDIEVDFDRADIMAIIDMRDGKDRVELQVNSLLIYGQYNKYSREIPQTVWHCRNCRGSGCEECDWTGKNYETSVQEIIQEPFIPATNAIEAKFHGGGREDVDARCLGKREFVLELIEPLNRSIDLEELQEKVNESQDKVEIFNLRFAEKDEIEEIKEKHADKTYRAYVELEDEVEEEDLEKLEQVVGEVEQRTPERVEHRRADKVRTREVYSINWKKTGEKKLELEIAAEAGTYIKELVHGDEARTQPNVSEILGTQAEVEKLDVIDIEK